MPITAKLQYLRIAPRKVRMVADLIRGKTIEEAQTILNFTVKKTAHPLLKLLKQAIANAKNNFQTEQSNLYISKITVDEGPKLKRWRARARGRAYEIQKKTSHLTLTLSTQASAAKRRVEEGDLSALTAIKGKKLKKIKKAKKEMPKLRAEREALRPKVERGLKRVFRRKAF